MTNGWGASTLATIGVVTALCGGVTACTIAPAPEGAPSVAAASELPPPGFGTLLQSEVSLSLTSRDLQILVTPLAESVTRVTAPDTYERLSSIAGANPSATLPGSTLFLVSFFTDEVDVRFIPEEVQLISGGVRVLPSAIQPITPSWGQRRVQQRRTEMAVYAFPSVDMESELILVYGFDQTAEWSAILPRIQGERARARARAGIGQASRPYLEILR